jgi:hypothetical protein
MLISKVFSTIMYYQVDNDTLDADSIDRDESDDNSEKEESSVDSLDEDSKPNVKKGKHQTTQTLGAFELKPDYILPNPSHQITVEFTQLLQQHGLAVIDNANGFQFFKEMTYAEVTARLQQSYERCSRCSLSGWICSHKSSTLTFTTSTTPMNHPISCAIRRVDVMGALLLLQVYPIQTVMI